MNINDIPGIGKYKAYIGAAILMLGGLSGFFHALGDVTGVTELLLSGQLSIVDWFNQASAAASQAWLFGLGLVGVGVRHAQKKATGI
jgi:hypothetical protein